MTAAARLAALQAAYNLALRAASAELDRACRAAADEFGPQIDAAKAELAGRRQPFVRCSPQACVDEASSPSTA